MSVVSLIRCSSYDEAELYQTMKTACMRSGLPECQGKRILLKPNVLSDAPVAKAITTHPMVVKCMIRILQEARAKEILVGDSPGLQGSHFVPKACGIAQVCDQMGVRWVDLTQETEVQEVPFTGKMKLPFSKLFDEVDLIITLPKLKTHKLMYATGALKNQFGLVPGLHKSKSHIHKQSRQEFAELISGINTLHKPGFALMDAIIGMEGEGPANGNARFLGLILASRDLVSLDWAEGLIMGYDPMDLPLVRSALRHGLGTKPTFSDLDAHGLGPSDWKRIPIQKGTHLFGDLILPFLTRKLHSRVPDRPVPHFHADRCIHCQRCVRICPAQALKEEDKKIVLDDHKCIRCYCCHEMCPVSAITTDS